MVLDVEKEVFSQLRITQPCQKEDSSQLQGCMKRRTKGSREDRGMTGFTASCTWGCLLWKRDEGLEDNCCSARG